MPFNVKQLGANPRNPRKIEENKLKMLAKSMVEFGSLDGFIYNIRSKQLVGGHQRQKIMPEDAIIKVEKKYSKKTRQGTIAVGYVEYDGERWPYREVDWDKNTEKAANIAANKGAGDWDLVKLQEFVLELDESNFDLDLTMFDEIDRSNMFTNKEIKNSSTELNLNSFDNFQHECPKCGFEWNDNDKT